MEQKVKQKDSINFFICYDSRSLIYEQMKAYVETLNESKNVYCYNLPDLTRDYLEPNEIPTLSNLLRALKAKSESSILNVIVDEFDIEDLNYKESNALNLMFKSTDWEQCSVVLLAQPMIKNRTLVSPGEPSINYKTDSEAYKTIDCMAQYTLKYHMRSSLSNLRFTEAAAEIVAKEVKNTITHYTPDISGQANGQRKAATLR